MDITVIVPLYNETESLPELAAWIKRVMDENGYSYEILMVDDGSTDGSWDTVLALAKEYPAIHGISFRRNYGKSATLYEGFAAAQGDVVITMDADLQDSPDEIPELYRMITKEGYDVVSGWKQHRKDNKLTKNLPSKLYNWTARKVTGIKLHDMNCGLKAYKKEVVKSIEVYGEMHRYIPYLAKNAGYGKIGEKPVHHQKRKYGTSKFGLERFVNGENSVGHIGAALSERLHNPGDLRYLKTDFTQIITLCKHAFCLVKIVQRAVIQNHDPIRYTRDILHAV